MSSYRFAQDDDEQWAARCTDARLRRKVQNRLNQRALRNRHAVAERERQMAITSRRMELRVRPVLPKGAAQNSQQPPKEHTEGCHSSLMSLRQLNALQLLSPSLENYHTRKNFFLAYTIQWPKYNVPGGEFWAASFFHQCLADPLLLDTVVNGIAIYRLSAQYHPEDLQTLWKSQNRVSRGVREALAAGVVSDVVLNAVRVLGTRITAAPSCYIHTRGYFRSVGIEAVGGLELEGLLDFADDHYLVLAQLVEARGGLQMVQLPGITEKISRIDVLRACLRNERPVFDLPLSAVRILESELIPHRLSVSDVDSFYFLDDHFKDILMDLRRCCHLIEAHHACKRSELPSSLALFGHCRDVVQHRLLGLPHSCGDVEIARLAGLVFTYGVTYPLPRPNILCSSSALLLQALAETVYLPGQSDEFLLWAAMVGALGMGGSEGETNGFIPCLRDIRDRLGITEWEDGKIICNKFVWLGQGCDEGAALVWDTL
ncbi:hypothetical protein PG990_013936 [Apiospora arundinis]